MYDVRNLWYTFRMNNTFYFLRHGKTTIDKNTPISKWILSEEGKMQADTFAKENIFDEVNFIFSSTEDKAYKTALPTAKKLGKEVIMLETICELNRDNGGFLELNEYEKNIKQCLENPDKSFNNWEKASHALERFSKQISELDKTYTNQKILVVGHGFTINMYFAKLLGIFNKTYERLGKNDFADWGVVKNQEVVIDIGK